MVELQTMPLRFRVWNKKNNETYSDRPIEEVARLLKVFGKNNTIVCQYTGIKDKNGRNIYIGDIIVDHGYTVNYVHKLVGFVTTSRIAAAYTISSPMNGYVSSSLVLSKTNQYEVIGNIWQNPELLKEVDNE